MSCIQVGSNAAGRPPASPSVSPARLTFGASAVVSGDGELDRPQGCRSSTPPIPIRTNTGSAVETGGKGCGYAFLALLDLLGVDAQQGLGRVAETGGDGDRVVAVSQGGAGGPVAQVV